MTFPTKTRNPETSRGELHTLAPAPHVDALLRILEDTDRALEPLMLRGMDGRTAAVLREIEKTGAIALTVEGDDIWVDVIDRKKALSVIDKLIARLT
ncbi:hypothetical protein [Ponticaulis profundi]|uniref:Uncharacterized protein n=1 Tax=Ponticaulis profundi TaxID=2665222 RepID=A0ABW1S6D5_9PROT